MSVLFIFLLLMVYMWLDTTDQENQQVTLIGKEHFDE